MPILIVMNKPYDDDEALRTVVNYVTREGYGYCGGYAVNPRYAFEEMAVLVRDMERYAPLLEAAFDRYGVPYYMDRVESVDILPLFRFVSHLMQAAAGHCPPSPFRSSG